MPTIDPLPDVVTGTWRFHLHRYALGPRDRFGTHQHPVHQLSWAATGTIHAEVGSRSWVLPPALALWIPGGVAHDVSAIRTARFHSVYFDPDRYRRPAPWTEPVVVSMSPLLQELVAHLAEPAVDGEQRTAAEQLLLAAMTPVPMFGIDVPMPSDDRAREVADALLATPADDRSLTEWGREVGASSRTLARLFRHQTGMSFASWRTVARMRAALVLLGQDTPTTIVASSVGYTSPSAFAAAFHRHFGEPPSRYFRTAPTGV